MQVIALKNYQYNINTTRPSFKKQDNFNERTDFSREICNLIEEGKYGELQSKILLTKNTSLLPSYNHVFTKNYNTETLNIFAFWAKKYMELKDSTFSKKDNERALLVALAEHITNLDDFNPNANKNNKSSLSILDYCLDIKNDKFAKMLVKSKKFDNNLFELSRITNNLTSFPETTREIIINYMALIKKNEAEEIKKSASSHQLNKSTKKNSKLETNRVIPSKYTPKNLNEVGGMFEAKKAVNEFIIKPWSDKYRSQLIKNDIQMPNGFLLYGPPGCGKTYLVQAISQELDSPLYLLDLSSLGSSLGYETQNNLNEFFDILSKEYQETGEPQIVLLDELDSICGNRATMHTDWKRDDVNAVLKLLNNASEKGIIVLGATNFLDGLDPAILRTGRFDKKLEILPPNENEIKDILTKMLKFKPMAKMIMDKIPQIAKLMEGKTCSDINACIQLALRNAIFDNKVHINMSDIEKAINDLNFDKDKNIKLIGFTR